MRTLIGKSAIIVFLLTVFSFANLYPVTISVMVVETGLDEKPQNELVNIWETGMMDALFDAGHIVSNAQSVLIERVPDEDIPEEISGYVSEAEDGGFDYFVVAFLEYKKEKDFVKARPEKITLKLLSFSNNRIIFDEKMAKPVKFTPSDEYDNAKKAAKIIMPYLGKTRKV
ncbi:hypothetical protein AGMMS50212_15620 [Spirochaetia bacterium]|nr:hypothetical protein AGMMS50212_15620 [Spirochaetia bacterium]